MSIRHAAYERVMAALAQAATDGEEWQAAVLEDGVLETGSWQTARDSDEYTRASNALGLLSDAKRAIRAVG